MVPPKCSMKGASQVFDERCLASRESVFLQQERRRVCLGASRFEAGYARLFVIKKYLMELLVTGYLGVLQGSRGLNAWVLGARLVVWLWSLPFGKGPRGLGIAVCKGWALDGLQQGPLVSLKLLAKKLGSWALVELLARGLNWCFALFLFGKEVASLEGAGASLLFGRNRFEGNFWGRWSRVVWVPVLAVRRSLQRPSFGGRVGAILESDRDMVLDKGELSFGTYQQGEVPS
ncbi:hypothetical protein L3X38_017765 [Prunus dulcis]|uniref:Uncharacterized protein n=1 Tax=Prunus dulcis TaxID=3755 RepID=A0AAD4W9I8_PRUDU|nr:hypothetical protein L3X38_017765 [Prunus dulcis]